MKISNTEGIIGENTAKCLMIDTVISIIYYCYSVLALGPYVPSRNLRSSPDFYLLVLFVHQSSIGSPTFSRPGPELWNQLPYSLENTESIFF